jgi:hypothetical protein
MSNLTPVLTRAISVIVIGGALAAAHVSFAAAAGSTSSPASRDATSASPENLPENCYLDDHVVRSVRGKAIVLKSYECD